MESQLSMAFVLLVAGNETTRGLIADAAKLLFEHPDQRRLLADDPELLPSAVEEFLRFQSPVTHMCRTALADTELRGRQIARGDYLCMLYPAANRDEEIWDRADELDVTRAPDPGHLAFGFAEHFCLGASLARREIRLVLGELLQRYPNYELVGRARTRARAHDAGDQDDAGRVPPVAGDYRYAVEALAVGAESFGEPLVGDAEVGAVVLVLAVLVLRVVGPPREHARDGFVR